MNLLRSHVCVPQVAMRWPVKAPNSKMPSPVGPCLWVYNILQLNRALGQQSLTRSQFKRAQIQTRLHHLSKHEHTST